MKYVKWLILSYVGGAMVRLGLLKSEMLFRWKMRLFIGRAKITVVEKISDDIKDNE